MAEACGVSRSMVQMTAKEDNTQTNANRNMSSSPCKTINNGTTVIDTENSVIILRHRAAVYTNAEQIIDGCGART
jgi:hypothetical protein